MDQNHQAHSLETLGVSEPSSPRSLPSRDDWPDVDDHIVAPENAREEIIGGRKVRALPAEPPHANQKTRLNYVIGATVAPGFHGASGLLTRYGVDSDFASDTCVYKAGVDPRTGGRYLEEIAFVVVSRHNQQDVAEKAVWMHRRGVRRIFAVFAEKRQVAEWSVEEQSWHALDPASQLEDPCLTKPIPVRAFFDKAASDKTVLDALAAKENSALRQWESLGRSEGKAEDVIKVLEARGLAVNSGERQAILSCRDLGRLDRWLVRAVVASSTAEVVVES
jgi:hypothetical protein